MPSPSTFLSPSPPLLPYFYCCAGPRSKAELQMYLLDAPNCALCGQKAVWGGRMEAPGLVHPVCWRGEAEKTFENCGPVTADSGIGGAPLPPPAAVGGGDGGGHRARGRGAR